MQKNFFLLFIIFVNLALYSCNKKAYSGFNHSPAYHQYTRNESPEDLPCPDPEKRHASSSKKTTLISPEQHSENIVPNHEVRMAFKAAPERVKPTNKEIIKSGIKKIKEIRSLYKTKKEVPIRLSRALWLLIPGAIFTTLGILLQSYFYTEIFTVLFAIIFVIGVFALIRYLADPKGKKAMNN